ncbi:cytochrome P450 [Whalleya microplaca]|nr:cytochrome P450 [Whalleya microplaca]
MTMNSTDFNGVLVGEKVQRILAGSPSNKLATVVVTITIAVSLWFFLSYQFSPLKQYPGPLLAGFTNLWRIYLATTAEFGPRMKKLHEKYGPVVRIGPNLLDLDIPELIKVIYGTDGKWVKSDFYKITSSVIDGKITYNMFSETDIVQHARFKRPVVRHYSLGSVLAVEPIMDQVIADFCKHLETRFIAQDKSFDLGSWLTYYAWDFVSAVTFSKRFGYMDKGFDFDGTISINVQTFNYLAYVGQIPWLDHCLDKNPIVRLGPPNLANATRAAAESLFPRLKGEDPNFDPNKPDFLQYFIDSKTSHPDVVDNPTIMTYLLLNLLAGADTTLISIHALLYHTLRNPRVLNRLTEEVLAANINSSHPAPYSTARTLPYLEAITREAMRMHPAVSMQLERIVPKSGLTLPDGRFIPGGSLVGINPYVMGRNFKIYGDDTEEFRPERWLRREDEGDDEFQARMRLWNATDLSFGSGSRICVGRHLALMEMYKIVATLIAKYEIQLVDPEEKWQVHARWFHRVDGGLTCKLRQRDAV